MKIAIGTDHAGYLYKEKIKDTLQASGYTVQDFGTHSEEPVDYPLYIRPAALAVAKGQAERGIILGGSGNGEAVVANRIPGIRCALCWNPETARLARSHNDANMLSLGARMLSLEQALDIVRTWLDTPFDGGRHLRRIQQIDGPEIAQVQEKHPSGKKAPRTAGTASDVSTPQKPDVLIAFRFIKYFEGRNALEFQVDPGIKDPTVIHVPSKDRWESEVAPWAKHRREEILSLLKEKCSHMSCVWKEY